MALDFGQVASYIVIMMTWPPLGGDYCSKILGVLQPSSKPTMELLTHGDEHHEIGDGGWLMMTTTTDSPLRSPERTPDQPSRESLGLGGGSVS